MANWAFRLAPPVTRCAGSDDENSQNSTAVTSSATAYTCGTMTQAPPAAISAGATNLVMAEPELPAPNTPMARPRFVARGNQRAT